MNPVGLISFFFLEEKPSPDYSSALCKKSTALGTTKDAALFAEAEKTTRDFSPWEFDVRLKNYITNSPLKCLCRLIEQ